MRTLLIGLTCSLVLASTSPAAAQMPSFERTLQLSFNADGTINLAAQNVTVRDILAEWARQCQCHVVNAEQLSGGVIMMPLQFERATQSAVLGSLLRQAAGYVLTPKRAGSPGGSNYETIFILATSNPVAGPYIPPPVTVPSLLPTTGSPDDELPPVVPIRDPEPNPSTQTPAQAPSSNPFGSRSTSPFGTTTPGTGPTAVPGSLTPSSAPGNMPYQPPPPTIPGTPAAPLPSGTAMPIVAVPPGQ